MGIFFLTFRVLTLQSVFKNVFYQLVPTDLSRIQALKCFKYLSGSVGLNLTPSSLMGIDSGDLGITALKMV